MKSEMKNLPQFSMFIFLVPYFAYFLCHSSNFLLMLFIVQYYPSLYKLCEGFTNAFSIRM